MKRVNLVSLALLCAAAGCAERDASRWPQVAIGELAFLAPATVDEMQTLDITARCRETNALLGPCAENVSVGLYFFAVEVIHLSVSALLPGDARRWWQGLTAGSELATAWKNHEDGIRVLP
jgi:hypothetical protein